LCVGWFHAQDKQRVRREEEFGYEKEKNAKRIFLAKQEAQRIAKVQVHLN
jgi:hypothetical protein